MKRKQPQSEVEFFIDRELYNLQCKMRALRQEVIRRRQLGTRDYETESKQIRAILEAEERLLSMRAISVITRGSVLRRSAIQVAPGTKIAATLRWVFTKTQYELIFEPQVAEMQREYCEALKAGQTRKTKWVRVRLIITLTVTVIMAIPERLVAMWKAASS